GRATQKGAARGGTADRAIDGNTGGKFADGGVSHTAEGTEDPWWEVDLGAVYPIDSITVYNRTDGKLGRRLDKFSLLVLAADRSVVYQQLKQPAPAVKATFAVGASPPAGAVRRAA